MPRMFLPSRRFRAAAGMASLAVAAGGLIFAAAPNAPASTTTASTASSTGLGACPFWSTQTPPSRTPGPGPSVSPEVKPLDESYRTPAPSGIKGSLSNGKVSITFNRVSGAQGYRVWRNSQSVAWITEQGQSTYTVVDSSPCDHAFYTVAVITGTQATDATTGQLSEAYRLGDDGVLAAYAYPVGATLNIMATSYNDVGQTASGYNTQEGICAVDPRIIPWGQRFYVPGYGYCYAADIGTWIQGDTVDLWLPGTQSNNWGVQSKTITFVSNTNPTAPPSTSPSSSPSSTPPPSTKYQAESSANTLAGGASVFSCSSCSGGKRVGRIGKGGTLTFNNVKVATSGKYTVTVAYTDGSSSSKSAQISTNGGGSTTVSFASTGSYSTPKNKSVTLTLKAGSNTIKFANSSASAPDIDAITVAGSPSASATPTPTATKTPTPTPTATPSPTPTKTPTPTPTPTPSPTSTQPAGAVANAGFESGALSPWSCTSGSVVSSPVHAGSHALKSNPTASDIGQCSQTVSVSPNHTYTLSAYLDGAYVYVGATTAGTSAWSPSTSGAYQKLSVSFTTGASQTSETVYVHGWYGEGSFYADDVTLS